MKLGKVSLSGASVVLLAVQLAIVCSIAAKYLYQRMVCPRVWVQTVAFDPDLPMRGRYLSAQLVVDGCQSTLPSAEMAVMPRDKNGVQTGKVYTVHANIPFRFPARIQIANNKLVAIRLPEFESQAGSQMVAAWPGASCENLRLEQPVDFYLAEHAEIPTPLRAGQQLWVEVTVPPQGPPRPLRLAIKDNGAWRPLNSQ